MNLETLQCPTMLFGLSRALLHHPRNLLTHIQYIYLFFNFMCHNDVISLLAFRQLRLHPRAILLPGCVRLCTPTCLCMRLMCDEVSHGDWGILLPSIEPRETELNEIFYEGPDTTIQIRCSWNIKQTLVMHTTVDLHCTVLAYITILYLNIKR